MKMKRIKKPAAAATPARNPTVRLQYHVPEAKRVCVAGSFNGWQVEAAPLKAEDDGLGTLELELRPGTYEYRLIVDGCWCDDPNATETVPNPFGGYNAVLRVSAPA
jgi:1,4-alpha-glucan branching enzyme